MTLGLFVRRWISGEYRSARGIRVVAVARFGLAPLAALVVFALQLSAVDGFEELLERARWRIGGVEMDGGDPIARAGFWLGHSFDQYGVTGTVGIVGGTAVALVLAGVWGASRRKEAGASTALQSRMVGIGLLASLPCLAQIYTLRQHSAVHDFSVLKLVVPLAILPLVVLPLALLVDRGARESRRRATSLAAAAVAALYLGSVHSRFPEQFPEPKVAGGDVAELLRRNTGYADVVFSPDFEIGMRPPQLLAIARNRVYRVSDPKGFRRQATRRAGALEEEHRVDLLFAGEVGQPWRWIVRDLEPVTGGGATLYLDVPRQRWFRPPAAEPLVSGAAPP